MIRDLFGNLMGRKTLEEEYSEYINSAQWRKLRAAKLAQSGERCEICGLSKWSVNLEVHHKNYKHFKNERMEDLQVLCRDCHTEEDKVRVIETEAARQDKAIIKGFENWMDSGNNEGWRRKDDRYLSGRWLAFLNYLANKQRNPKLKDIPYWRSPNWK